MLCKQYTNLTHKERTELIGQVIHALQSSDECFNEAMKLRNLGETKGLYLGVTILPEKSPTGTDPMLDDPMNNIIT